MKPTISNQKNNLQKKPNSQNAPLKKIRKDSSFIIRFIWIVIVIAIALDVIYISAAMAIYLSKQCATVKFISSLPASQEQIMVRVSGLECWGCGYDINHLETEDYPYGPQIANTTEGIAFECLDNYQKVEDSLYDDYSLKVVELDEFKKCIEELEKEGYCANKIDCCGPASPVDGEYLDSEECPYFCVDSQCQEIEFIKVDDIYGEWPIYYDQFVEFEGYIVYVYSCPPCPPGATCEACFEPYYTVYKEPELENKYYEPGQIVVKHILGEELQEGRKYLIKGRLLPPEQAFLVDIVGIVDGDFPVIEPSEPAVEMVE